METNLRHAPNAPVDARQQPHTEPAEHSATPLLGIETWYPPSVEVVQRIGSAREPALPRESGDLNTTSEPNSVGSVAIVGLGYVGVALAARFDMANVATFGFDIDEGRISDMFEADLNPFGPSYIPVLKRLAASDCFEASADPSALAATDAVIVCVPTPLTKDDQPDLSAVQAAGREVGRHLRPGQLVVLESTTYPGTTRNIFHDSIRRTCDPELTLGTDYFLGYSPERENPGDDVEASSATPKLVGGVDAESTRRAVELYAHAFPCIHEVPSVEVAEAAKLFENTFRSVNIALVNELKHVLQTLNVDVDAVLDAAASKPYGFMRFDPGPGVGGHCIPIDPLYLAARSRESGVKFTMIERAAEINRAMPGLIVDAVANELGDTPAGAHVHIVGVAYKPGVGDVRESPALDILDGLQEHGITVSYSDPFVESVELRNGVSLERHPLNATLLDSCEAVVIVTSHDQTDLECIANAPCRVFDSRNAMNAWKSTMQERLVRI